MFWYGSFGKSELGKGFGTILFDKVRLADHGLVEAGADRSSGECLNLLISHK